MEGSEGSSPGGARSRPLVSKPGGTLRERRRDAGTRKLCARALTLTCAAALTMEGALEGFKMTPGCGGADGDDGDVR